MGFLGLGRKPVPGSVEDVAQLRAEVQGLHALVSSQSTRISALEKAETKEAGPVGSAAACRSLGKEPSGVSCASNDGCRAQNARRLRPQ